MKKIMILLSALSVLLTIVFYTLWESTEQKIHFSLFITLFTTAFHLVMRLAVGYGINAVFHNRIDYMHPWFRQSFFEKRLYSFLKVKRWKDKMPTYSPANFSLTDRSAAEISGAMCQAEIVHEIIVLFSFLPIVLSFWIGDFLIFLITSLAAALYDLCFVIIQRYNRPRIIKLLVSREKKNEKMA